MINAVKMDISRMFKTKAFKVLMIIWVIMIGYCVYDCFSNNIDAEYKEKYQYTLEEGSDYRYVSSMAADDKYRIPKYEFDYYNTPVAYIFNNVVSNAILVFFVVLFTAIFVSKEKSSGYLKNISNHVKNRGILVLSKGIVLTFYDFLLLAIAIAIVCIIQLIFAHHIVIGSIGLLAKIVFIHFIANIGFSMLIMAICIISDSVVVSVSMACMFSTNVFLLMYNLISYLINKFTPADNFDLIKYTLSGNYSLIDIDMMNSEYSRISLLAVFYIVISVIIGYLIYKNKDVK